MHCFYLKNDIFTRYLFLLMKVSYFYVSGIPLRSEITDGEDRTVHKISTLRLVTVVRTYIYIESTQSFVNIFTITFI